MKKDFKLKPTTLIDVVAKRGAEVFVKSMTVEDAKNITKKKGWTYQNFQAGFHTYKNTN